jgi:hypothetical protein
VECPWVVEQPDRVTGRSSFTYGPRVLLARGGLTYIPRVPAPKNPKREFKVGDRVTVSLSGGRIVDATVTAVVKRAKGTRLQVSYGKDETALVYLWQVRPSQP